MTELGLVALRACGRIADGGGNRGGQSMWV
jgi:hypothetical protein